MTQKDKNFATQFGNLSSKTLGNLVVNFNQIIKSRDEDLIKALVDKDLIKIINLSVFFKDRLLSTDAVQVLTNLNYSQEDREFMSYLMNSDNYYISFVEKERVFYKYLSKSLTDSKFYNLIKSDFPKEMKNVIRKKFSIDALNTVDCEIFIDLIKSCGLMLEIKSFNHYIKNDSLPILKKIFDCELFDKFLDSKKYKIRDLALTTYQEKSARYLSNALNCDSKASVFLSNDQDAENFCKLSPVDFFTYVVDEFDFENDQNNILHLIYHLRKTKSPEKWKIAIDCLVKNNIDNSDFMEQLKRKIEMAKSDDPCRELAINQFNFCRLNYLLKDSKVKEKNTQIKL